METNLEFNEKSLEAIRVIDNKHSRMKCIRCPECDEEILMVPTLGKMIEAIENHVSSHRRQAQTDVAMSRLKMPSIRISLTEQVLQQASEMTDVNRTPSFWL